MSRKLLTVHVTGAPGLISVWGKARINAFMWDNPGGTAMSGGDWLDKTYLGKPVNSTLCTLLDAGENWLKQNPDVRLPIMIGVTIYDGEDKDNSKTVDKIAMVADALAKNEKEVSARAVYTDDPLKVEFIGNFAGATIRSVMNRPTPGFDYGGETGNIIRSDESRKYKATDPYYWAAYELYRRQEIHDIEGAGVDMPQLRFHGSQTIEYEGKKLELPPELCFLYKLVNGLWLIGVRGDNRLEVSLAETLLDYEGELDPNLKDFLDDQADKMNALAETYRLASVARWPNGKNGNK